MSSTPSSGRPANDTPAPDAPVTLQELRDLFGKLPGRVGDTPIIGAGTWADDHAAISCTGQGEYFLRVQAAAQVAFRIGAGQGAFESAGQVLEQIARMGGEGGLIVVTRSGEVHAPFRSAGMKRAWFSGDGDIVSEAF